MSSTGVTLGVEEEFQLVDPVTGQLQPCIEDVLPVAEDRLGPDEVQAELQRSQIETGTPIARSLGEIRAALVRLRRQLADAAEAAGYRIAATGTFPDASFHDQQITPKDRYLRMEGMYGLLVRDQLVCGCHVHVGVDDRDLAIQILNRSRPWLAPLLALAANSPFWAGADTGYASYRTMVWSRWPTAGPPGAFTDRADYDDMVERLLASGVIPDRGMLYWDVRPSASFETLEYRVSDVCLSVDDAVLVAGLVRALVRTEALAAERGDPPAHIRQELLRASHWRAARSGLDETLLDPVEHLPRPAADVVGRLVDHVRDALDDTGDVDEVTALVAQVLERGTGAARQRRAFERRGELRDVVDLLVAETAPAIAR